MILLFKLVLQDLFVYCIYFLSSSVVLCRFEYLFNFDSMFEIHDDIEVLKRMGMACGLEVGKCSAEDLKIARSLVPKALEPYVTGQTKCFHSRGVTIQMLMFFFFFFLQNWGRKIKRKRYS